MKTRFIISATVILAIPFLVLGQAIQVKTIPLIMTQQFMLVPSYNAGMAGVSIGHPDEIAEGFVNPARLGYLSKNLLFVAPYRDSWSQRLITGRWWQPTRNVLEGSMVQAVPGGAITHFALAGGRLQLTTALALSLEQLRHTSDRVPTWNNQTGQWNPPMQMKVMNWPRSAAASLRFPDKGLSVGVGVDWVDIYGVDGIQLLYPGAREVRQNGTLRQYRLGAALEKDDGSRYDMLLFHRRYQMDQLAIYSGGNNLKNKDEEQSWLLQLKGRVPVESHSHIGFELTGHYKWHPKIPDYPAPEIRIPRDPGITKAGRLGIGFSTREGKLLIAFDATLEIIDSKTWGDTTAAVTADDGTLIPAGEPLFRNDYYFNNSAVRIGLEYTVHERFRLQGGWSSRLYSLDYDHEDFVTGEVRGSAPQNWWKEPALSAGMIVKMGNIEWIYHASKRSIANEGVSQQMWGAWPPRLIALSYGGDILTPPTDPGFRDVPIVLHRLTLLYWF